MPSHAARHKVGEVCPECGFVHLTPMRGAPNAQGKPACVGHVKHPIYRACTQAPMLGQDVCRFHGGAAKQNRAAGARRVAKIKAIATLARMGIPVETTPEDALLGQVAEAAGNVEFLREQVQQEGAEWLELYSQERDRLVRMSALAIGAGIAERQVQLAERQGALVADVIRKLLDDPELGLNSGQRDRGRLIAAKHLRLVG